MEINAIGLIQEDAKGIQAEQLQGLTLAQTQTHKNIYGLIQSGSMRNQHLHKRVTELGYRQSKIDPSLYYRSRLL